MDSSNKTSRETAHVDKQFVGLWRTVTPRMTALAYHLAGRNRDDAQDLLSEVVLRLLTAFRKQDGQVENFAAWAARTLRNQWTDGWRQKQFRQNPSHHLTECQFAAVGLVSQPPKTFPSIRAEAERVSELQRHIQSIPKIYRDTFILHCVLQRPYASISEQMGVPQATLRKRVQLAKKLLQNKAQYYDE